MCVSIYLSINLSIHIYLSIYLSIYIFLSIPIYLSIEFPRAQDEPYLDGIKYDTIPPGKRFMDMTHLSGGTFLLKRTLNPEP